MTEKQELIDILMLAVAGALADLHTATVAKVTSVGSKTISCKPVINRFVDGQSIELPVFAEVPPVFLGGGSSFMSFPVSSGDYCLLIFSERCFDRWWNGQDFQEPAEFRMHDYSDGFALCGLKNMLSAITIPDETTINGVMRLGNENPSDFAALASKVEQDFQNVVDAITGAAVVAADGGAAFKANIIAALTTSGVPNSVASTFVKAD